MPKPTKARKVTDREKAWNRKAKPTAYSVASIPMNKTILIVCEGQTEKLYFEAFPVLGLRVDTINLEGQSKLKMVGSTQELNRNLRR